MNRYMVIDFKENVILDLNKIDMDFKENEQSCGSTKCTNMEELIGELYATIDCIEYNVQNNEWNANRMNRYMVIDFKTKTTFDLNKINMDFEENDNYTGSVSCINIENLIDELKEYVEYLENNK